jgi:hypothetical protein
MRPVLHGDLLAAAMRVSELPSWQRAKAAARLIDRAHAADAARKRLGRSMTGWGNGSLMSAVLAEGPLPERGPRLDPGHLAAYRIVAGALLRWREEQQARGGRRPHSRAGSRRSRDFISACTAYLI